GEPRNGIARLTADGGLDNSFHSPLTDPNSGPAHVDSLVLQGEQVLMGGAFYSLFGPLAPILRRLNSDGSEDIRFAEAAFAWEAEVRSIVSLPNLEVIAGAGVSTDALSGRPVTNALVKRFFTDGSVDPSFSAALLEQIDFPAAFVIRLQSD